MRISYRTRQFYRRLLLMVLSVVLAALTVLLCWVLWLRRYILYTPDGARLDFSLSQQWPQGVTGQETIPLQRPDIYFAQDEEDPTPEPEDTRFAGFYVTVDELLEDLDGTLEKILNLPENTPIMVDVKGHWGYFYYPTSAGCGTSNSFDMQVMDAFFKAVNEAGLYTIARLPAFRDYAFAADNISSGLKVQAGYLWVDPDRVYWLDPLDDAVLTYLIQVTKELESMGFDEVAFHYFCFPDTNQVVYESDRDVAISKAAQTLVTTCANDNFTVSFITDDSTFPLPDGNCRLYLTDVAAYDVQDVLSLMQKDVVQRVVFFTSSNDTRYQQCGVIRPLYMA